MTTEETERPSWDEYFVGIARLVASRATCPRRSVGAVIVKDLRIISTGYNGSMPNTDHCTDVGCLMIDGHCERTIHAEVNAIAQAAKNGQSVNGATLYCTTFPCWNCFKSVVSSGIQELVFADSYWGNSLHFLPDGFVLRGVNENGTNASS